MCISFKAVVYIQGVLRFEGSHPKPSEFIMMVYKRGSFHYLKMHNSFKMTN